MDTLAEVAQWLQTAQRVVAFTGAGISTESGIPDFRSPGGVWSKSQPVLFDDFLASASARYEYWRQKAISHQDFSQSLPTAGHQVLARWEAAGRLRTVITQNIDGLHQQAGNREVIELHGTARAIVCLDCQARFDAGPLVEAFLAHDSVPLCPECEEGRLKHATISFGQSLAPDVLEAAIEESQRADLFFALGSSLVVQPAAHLPVLAKQGGARLVLINRDATPLDDVADAVVRQSIGETLSTLDAQLAEAQ